MRLLIEALFEGALGGLMAFIFILLLFIAPKFLFILIALTGIAYLFRKK